MASLQGQMSVLAVLVAVLVAACSSASSTTEPTPSLVATPTVTLSPSPTPSVTAAPPDTLASASTKALTAYRAMWRAYEAAIAIPDPSYPELSTAATGSALKILTGSVASAKQKKLKGTGTAKLSPRVVGFSPAKDPTTVTIRDCLDSSGTHLVNAVPGGTPYKDTPGGRRLTAAVVQRGSDGVWTVTSVGVRNVGTC